MNLQEIWRAAVAIGVPVALDVRNVNRAFLTE